MKEIFGRRLRELRKSKGITQSELALILNVTYYAVCNYERGKNMPSDDIKIMLAKFFNVSIDYMMGLTEDMYIHDKNSIVLLPKSVSANARKDIEASIHKIVMQEQNGSYK